jgi:hypothetical protein
MGTALVCGRRASQRIGTSYVVGAIGHLGRVGHERASLSYSRLRHVLVALVWIPGLGMVRRENLRRLGIGS